MKPRTREPVCLSLDKQLLKGLRDAPPSTLPLSRKVEALLLKQLSREG